MPELTRWESAIHAGGRETGPVIGVVATLFVTPRWLRFLAPQVFVTVKALDDVEAYIPTVKALDDVEVYIPGVRTVEQAHAVHDAWVARYMDKARR